MITSGVHIHVHSFNLKLYDTPFVTRNKTEYFKCETEYFKLM